MSQRTIHSTFKAAIDGSAAYSRRLLDSHATEGGRLAFLAPTLQLGALDALPLRRVLLLLRGLDDRAAPPAAGLDEIVTPEAAFAVLAEVRVLPPDGGPLVVGLAAKIYDPGDGSAAMDVHIKSHLRSAGTRGGYLPRQALLPALYTAVGLRDDDEGALADDGVNRRAERAAQLCERLGLPAVGTMSAAETLAAAEEQFSLTSSSALAGSSSNTDSERLHVLEEALGTALPEQELLRRMQRVYDTRNGTHKVELCVWVTHLGAEEPRPRLLYREAHETFPTPRPPRLRQSAPQTGGARSHCIEFPEGAIGGLTMMPSITKEGDLDLDLGLGEAA